jgi:hypothetical protein
LNTAKIHSVCVVGAAPDVAARINALLDEQRTQLEARWRPGDQANADLLVIDADSIYGHMDWLKASASGRLIAAYTKSPEAYNTHFWLRQPIVAADLVALLNRIGAQLRGTPDTHVAPVPAAPAAKSPNKTASPQFRTSTEAVALVAAVRATSAPAAPTAEAAPVAAPRVPAAPTAEAAPVAAPRVPAAPQRGIQLLDLLELDAPLKGRLRLAIEGLPTVLLDPRERAWHSASPLKALSAWCTRSLTADDVRHADDKEFASEVATMSSHPYARLQWLAHLVRGDGQLDPGLDVNGRYKLSRWPQSEREFPRHFRIATVMLKQPGTLEEIAEQGGATIGDVTNFINAYHALGYIELEGAERAQESASRGGLFGRMRKTSTN